MATTTAMAFSTSHCTTSHLLGPSTSSSTSFRPRVVAVGRRRNGTERFAVRANGGNLGDFGARDPFPEELGSNFGDKTLGNSTTDHQILVPTLATLSLSEKSIKPLPVDAAPFSEAEAKALLRKVVGWRLINQDSSEPLKLQCDWNLKDSDSVAELYTRLGKVADAENYRHEIQTLENNKVRVEVWTSSIGGLSENDFIFASKLDQVETKDLSKKLRTWF